MPVCLFMWECDHLVCGHVHWQVWSFILIMTYPRSRSTLWLMLSLVVWRFSFFPLSSWGCMLPSTDSAQQLREIRESCYEGKNRKIQLSWTPHVRASGDQTIFSIYKGVKAFDLCQKHSLLVTGGMDRLIRLWNPYFSEWGTWIQMAIFQTSIIKIKFTSPPPPPTDSVNFSLENPLVF